MLTSVSGYNLSWYLLAYIFILNSWQKHLLRDSYGPCARTSSKIYYPAALATFSWGQLPGMQPPVSYEEKYLMVQKQTTLFGLCHQSLVRHRQYTRLPPRSYLITREWVNSPPEALVPTTILFDIRRTVRPSI